MRVRSGSVAGVVSVALAGGLVTALAGVARAEVVSPCVAPAASSVKVRILSPDSGAVVDPAVTPALDVNGLVKGKGSEAVTGVQLYLDGVGAGTAPVTATTADMRSKGADGLWDRGIALTPGVHQLTACARTTAGAVAVDSIPVATPVVTTERLPDGVVGKAYSTQLATSVPNAVWRVTGVLPAGLSLSSGGVLAGTPTSAATTPISFLVVDRKQTQLAVHAVLTLTVASAASRSGVVCAWGAGESGELGDGAPFDVRTASATPVATGLSDVVAVGATRQSGYALKSDGTVWAWGSAENGQLGAAGAVDTSTPVAVSGLSGVTAIAGADETAYALKGDGTVWAWGLGGYGGLGNGTYDQSSATPVQVSGLTGITAIAGAGLSAFAVRNDGTVWGWGNGDDGQLGDQPGFDGHFSSGAPLQVPGLSGITRVAGNFDDGYALAGDGSVWAWGSGAHGALGDGTSVDSPHPVPVKVASSSGFTGIAAGAATAYARRGDGTVWSWGSGAEGGLGNGGTGDSATPVQVGGLTGVATIADTTGSTAFVVKGDGSVSAWGLGDYGALGNGQGLGTYQYLSSTPVRVGAFSGSIAAAGGDATGYAVVRPASDPLTTCTGPVAPPLPG